MIFVFQLKMTYSMTTSSPNINVDSTTLATEFQNASYQNENTTDVGNATSLARGMPSPKFHIITALGTFGVTGVLSNIAVLAVLFKKENRKLATNRYLINLAIKNCMEEMEKPEQLDIIMEAVDAPTTWLRPISTQPKSGTLHVMLCFEIREANKAIRRERHMTPTI
ncbi:hypothetical protein LSAT2_022587, partial [Lamellibrachia satsuma]